MNLFRAIILSIICTVSTFSLFAQQTLTSGIILNRSDSSTINHAHIINVTSKTGVTSNENGKFTISTDKDDTLIISFIGYHSFKIRVSEISTKIYLEAATYSIEPYTVLPYKNFKEFKDAFTNLELKDTAKHKMNPSIRALIKPFNPANINGGISFSGPFSSLAAKFNKRIKDRKNYEALLRKDKYEAFLATKFNPKMITSATDLKESSEIDYFMEYCDFSDQFIEFSSEYNLVDQILKCFEEYSHLPMATHVGEHPDKSAP